MSVQIGYGLAILLFIIAVAASYWISAQKAHKKRLQFDIKQQADFLAWARQEIVKEQYKRGWSIYGRSLKTKRKKKHVH